MKTGFLTYKEIILYCTENSYVNGLKRKPQFILTVYITFEVLQPEIQYICLYTLKKSNRRKIHRYTDNKQHQNINACFTRKNCVQKTFNIIFDFVMFIPFFNLISFLILHCSFLFYFNITFDFELFIPFLKRDRLKGCLLYIS